jgi:hypothetical protein
MSLCLAPLAPAQGKLLYTVADDVIYIDSNALSVQIRKKGYVSGTAAGSFVDLRTGARDLGFGLHIMDFLLGPGWKDDGYLRDKKFHGDLPKHYIEGPQICTKAKELKPKITRGNNFIAVQMEHTFTEAHNGYKAGSVWKQTLLFLADQRYLLSAEEITSANDVDKLIYRIDMPGHVKHRAGDSFRKIYLSYHGIILPRQFKNDFAPDDQFLYQRDDAKIPERFIRAYQVALPDNKVGPWLAGMTLDPAAVSEAWCHQRGYICFIQELHNRPVKKGETFGAAYVVGWFDSIADMERVYDQYKGTRRIVITDNGYELK